MDNKERLTSDLLVSVSGVLIFLSVSHLIDLNGFMQFAPVLLLLGVSMLFWSKPFLNLLKPVKIVSKPILLSISHILIFVGIKSYFDQFIGDYWLVYLIIGVILINYNQYIASRVMGKRPLK